MSIPIVPYCQPPDRNTLSPSFKLPMNTCDTHVHIFDSTKYPYQKNRSYTPHECNLNDLAKMHTRLGVERAVLIQASVHGIDNSAVLKSCRDDQRKKRCVIAVDKSINESQIEVPDIQMTTVTTLPSMDLQRLCRDMSNIGTEIEITRVGTKLRLRCDGDFANQETEIECNEESPLISGLYSLKYLNIFTKATSMCASVQILQEEANRFLILKYNVADLGELRFYLATKASEDQL